MKPEPHTPSPEPLQSTSADDTWIADLIGEFVATLPDNMGSMQKALGAGDWVTLKRLAHSLAGAAGSYGFQPITNAARELENLLKSNVTDPGVVRPTLDALVALCGRARSPDSTPARTF